MALAQEPLPLVSFYFSDKGFGETNGMAWLGIYCDRPPVTVHLEYSGTATPNVDYTDSMGTIPIPAVRTFLISDNTASIVFVGKKDAIEESNESLVVRILPDPSYVISSPGGASFTITNQSAPPNIPPRIQFQAFPSPVLSRTNLSISVLGWDIDGVVTHAQVFTNMQMLTDIVSKGASRTNTYSFTWTNPPAGIYQLTATIFDDLGASTTTPPAPLIVANDIVAPAASASVTSTNVTSFPNAVETGFNRRGAVEWNIPKNATNQQGFVRFLSNTSAQHQRLWIYKASGADISPAILNLSREFVTSAPHGATGFVTVDITPWVQRFAGKRIGLLFETDLAEEFPEVARNGTQIFYSFSLVLLPANSYEIPPRIRWLDVPHQVPYGSPITVRGEILAPGWADLSVAVVDELGPVASATIDQRGAVTNIFSATLTNFSLGPHYLGATASHGATNYSGEFAIIQVTEPDPFPHDYIQTTGGSGSFIIVDLAGRAHVWGRNNEGQLGLGFWSPSPVSTPVTLIAPEGRRWKSISSGHRYSVGFTDDGSYWHWGSLVPTDFIGSGNVYTPTFGQLPAGSGGIVKIVAMDGRSLFLDQKRRLLAFMNGGLSLYGSGWWDIAGSSTNYIGISDGLITEFRTAKSFPPPASRSWKTISTSDFHSLALTSDGELYAWGENYTGGLPGHSSYSDVVDSPSLVKVAGVTGWSQIAAGLAGNLAVDDQGNLWAWGTGYTGAPPGQGNNPGKVRAPADVQGWLDIAVTDSFSMALAKDGRFFVWGNVGPGILADKNVSVAMFPELIATFPNITNPEARDIFVSFSASTNLLSGKVQILGPAGVAIPIQASSDLENWTTMTNLANPTGMIDWNVPSMAENRFYRVRGD